MLANAKVGPIPAGPPTTASTRSSTAGGTTSHSSTSSWWPTRDSVSGASHRNNKTFEQNSTHSEFKLCSTDISLQIAVMNNFGSLEVACSKGTGVQHMVW